MLTLEEVKARQTVLSLGVAPGDRDWEPMLSAALRGWPGWRIAQAYNLTPKPSGTTDKS